MSGLKSMSADHIDDLLLQEIFSLREQLKIAVAAIKSECPKFDDQEFVHRLKAVDYEQLMEEIAAEMERDKVKYHFTGKEIVEVEYDHSIDESNGYDIKTVAFIYKNKNTGQTYFIHKECENLEIFNDRDELIEFKIKEFENKAVQLNAKILFLKTQICAKV
jgi:hypothetical protein